MVFFTLISKLKSFYSTGFLANVVGEIKIYLEIPDNVENDSLVDVGLMPSTTRLK